MNLQITISLDNYSNIKVSSNEHPTLKECALEVVRELSKIDDYHIDSYARAYLIPLIHDSPKLEKLKKY